MPQRPQIRSRPDLSDELIERQLGPALIGDDHGQRSTDTPAHCEPTFEDMMIPLLYPANVQEVLDYGVIGIELSRFCGAWVGMK